MIDEDTKKKLQRACEILNGMRGRSNSFDCLYGLKPFEYEQNEHGVFIGSGCYLRKRVSVFLMLSAESIAAMVYLYAEDRHRYAQSM